MKKLISIICAVMMLLSIAVTTHAEGTDVLGETYPNYDATLDYSLVVNEPLDLLGLLNEELGFDIQTLVTELLQSKVTAEVVCDLSEDYLKGKMYLSANIKAPVTLSEDMKFSADLTGHLWIDYDFTSVESAKCLVVVKNPLSGQYMYLDLFDERMYGGGGGEEYKTTVVATVQELFSIFGDVEAMGDTVTSLIEEHANVTEKDGYTTITFTNDALVEFIFDAQMLQTEMQLDAMGETLTEEVKAETVAMLTSAYEETKVLLKTLSIFGDNDALVISYKTNADGKLSEMEEKMHIQFNVFELMVLAGEDASNLAPVTSENSNIDITFVAKATYHKIGDATVTVPSLTEENSVNLFDMMEDAFVYDYGDDYYDDYYYDDYYYQPEQFWDYATGRVERGGMYVDLEEFFESSYADADDLTGNIVLGEDGTVMVDFVSNSFGTVCVEAKIGEDNYLLNQTQLWCRKPFIVVDEYNWDTYAADKKVYVHIDVLQYILGAKVESMTTYLLDDDGNALTTPEYYFEIVRPNPGYVERPEDVSFIEDVSTGW